MTAPFSVGPSTLDDVETVRAVIDAVARERRHLTGPRGRRPDRFRSFVGGILAGGGVQMVVRSAGRVVGWCDVDRFSAEGCRHRGVLGIGLLPDWRERRVGRALLSRTLDAADATGVERIELEVLASNTRAIRLFEWAGFIREGVKIRARILDGRAAGGPR